MSMNTNDVGLAIEIEHGVFHYGNNTVLNNLNLFVETGKITALLGPNGVGKTTVIRLIVGRILLNSGSVAVFGQTPGTSHTDIPGPGVGYMPQELALFEEFTIGEILSYYGLIYHMKSCDIEKRTQELTKLLEMPDKSRTVSKLSEGERRRVSIAVTLLHRPKLVILDEPTAGVDPLLRRDIWQHLKQISRDGQTVLITTHYIEEARSADSVVFMNSGKILAQGDPDRLMTAYSAKSLEQVFLLLFQATGIENTSEKIVHGRNKKVTQLQEPMKNKIKFDRQRVRALIIKNIRQTMRTIVLLGQTLLIPIVVISTHLTTSSFPKNNPIAIYNADTGSNLSTLFLDCLDKNYFRINEFSSNESAFDSVVKGKNRLSLVIPEDFGDNFEAWIREPLLATDEVLAGSQLLVSLDGTEVAFSLGAHQHFFTALMKFFAISGQLLVGHDLSASFNVLKIREHYHGELEFSYAKAIMGGGLIINVWLISMITSIHQIMNDKLSTSYERMLVAGVNKMEYMLAHLITTQIITMIPIVEILFALFYYYYTGTPSSIMTALALNILVSLMGWSIGYWAGTISSSYYACFTTTFYLYIMGSITSGAFWPRESIPTWFFNLTMLVPITSATTAFNTILAKGWTITAPTVQYGFISCMFYIFIPLVYVLVKSKH